MKFFKSLFIDIVFISMYFLMYRFISFEVAVIIALGQIMSTLAQQDKKEQEKNNAPTQSKNKIKF